LEEGEEFKSASEVDTNIIIEAEYHNFDELEEIFMQESCDDVVKVEFTNLEFKIVFFI